MPGSVLNTSASQQLHEEATITLSIVCNGPEREVKLLSQITWSAELRSLPGVQVSESLTHHIE